MSMFYATAGQQQQQGQGQQQQQQQQRGMSMGPGGGYPPMSATLGRGGPPGFGARGADPNDFPALGSSIHPSHSYAQSSQGPPGQPTSQAQSQGQAQGQSTASQQQQLYQMSGLAPAPPPGIGGTATQQQQQQGSGSNGNGLDQQQLRGEDFPALGDAKDRMNYLRSQQPSSPINMPNGASSHSLSGTPSSQAQAVPGLGGTGGSASTITGATVQAGASGGGGGAITGSDWATRHSPLSTAAGTDTGVGGAAQRPANANAEPIVRPVQQILSSPVDKWGLKALLYEITTQMGKTDRGLLMFGEKLAELGLDVTPEEPLHPTFVTPWQDPSQIQPSRIQELYHIPSHYSFTPTQMSSKMGQMSEETLMIAFYSSPQDLVQIEAAAELFVRGWRYHTEHQIWLNGPSLTTYEPPSPSESPSMQNAAASASASASASGTGAGGAGADSTTTGTGTATGTGPTQWLPGPFLYFDPRTFNRDRMPDDAAVNAAVLEWTMPQPVGRVEVSKDEYAAAGAGGR